MPESHILHGRPALPPDRLHNGKVMSSEPERKLDLMPGANGVQKGSPHVLGATTEGQGRDAILSVAPLAHISQKVWVSASGKRLRFGTAQP